MKFHALAASLLLVSAVSVQAEEPVEETAAVTAKFTTNMPIETLAADEAAAAVLEKHMPGMTSHPAYSQFKAMSLQQVKPFSQGMVTDELLEKVDADLAAIGSGDEAAEEEEATEE